jgi:hypothetical protein
LEEKLAMFPEHQNGFQEENSGSLVSNDGSYLRSGNSNGSAAFEPAKDLSTNGSRIQISNIVNEFQRENNQAEAVNPLLSPQVQNQQGLFISGESVRMSVNSSVDTKDSANTHSYSYNSVGESTLSGSKIVDDPDKDEEEVSADAMGAGAVSGKRNLDTTFYGSSAAISFMKDLFTVVDGGTCRLNEGEDNSSMGSSCKYTMSRNNRTINTRGLENMDVPPRRVADRYIKNYFDYAYTLYPFVHIPTFMQAYEDIWSVAGPENEVDELFYSILNIIFAFGCRLSPTGEENFQNGDLYFERSQELLRFHLMDPGSVLLVQALLLTGQFLQATTRLAGCWNIIGLAIRIAQGLGLHVELNLAFSKSCIDREIRKRLWHGCLLMDRIVSMTLGRPLMVTQDSGMELPLGVDDEYISDEQILPQNTPSILNFFLETVKLYHILSDILLTFYSNDPPEPVDLFLNMFKFEERLSLFHKNIPCHIKLETSEKGITFHRQSVVLQIRYLHLKIMLYRPILFPKKKLYKNLETVTELYANTRKSISLLCVATAEELINLITKYRAADINSLPATWYIVFYVYTAGTVLLAAKLQPSLKDTVESEVFENTWSKGISLLQSYMNQSESASRCLKVLQMMYEKVKVSTSRIQNLPKNTQESTFPETIRNSPSDVPPDVLYSLLYDTAGPFGGPFSYWDDMERYLH